MSSGRFQIQAPQRGATLIPPPSGAVMGRNTMDYSSPAMLGRSLINALIRSFPICFNDKLVPCGNLVTFCKYCWCICLHLPLSFFFFYSSSCEKTPFRMLKYFDMTELSATAQGDCTTHIPLEIQDTCAEEMSCDNISACCNVLCFVDKAIIHHHALDSKIPFSIFSGIFFFFVRGLLSALHFQIRFSDFYC